MLEDILADLRTGISKAHDSLRRDLSRLRTGRATSNMLDGVRVDYYGTPTPIAQMATVSIPEPRMIQVKVWERGQAKAVDKAIREADLGFNPQVDGDLLRIPLAPLTEERRKETPSRRASRARSARSPCATRVKTPKTSSMPSSRTAR